VVGQHDRDHRFRHRDEARKQAGIVTTLGLNRGCFRGGCNSALFDRQATGRLNGGSKDDWLPGRYAAEDSAVPV
jgi:hypothetical protein